ncbi:MAG: hypothetical protein ACI9OD_004088 [Limisphaerales bacterium]|jgi:hypothetical protein
MHRRGPSYIHEPSADAQRLPDGLCRVKTLPNETSHLHAYKRTKGRWAIPTARLSEIVQNRRAHPEYWQTLLRPTKHRPQQIEMFCSAHFPQTVQSHPQLKWRGELASPPLGQREKENPNRGKSKPHRGKRTPL